MTFVGIFSNLIVVNGPLEVDLKSSKDVRKPKVVPNQILVANPGRCAPGIFKETWAVLYATIHDNTYQFP